VSAISRSTPLGGTQAALTRYRVLAMIVGTGLATLCFVGIPLQIVGILVKGHSIWAGSSWAVGAAWPWTAVVAIVGTAHGIFYLIYLFTCLDLAGRARFRTIQLLGMVCSGLLPLLAFYMERKVSQRVKAQLALGDLAPPGPAATLWAALLRPPGAARRQQTQATAVGNDSSSDDDQDFPASEPVIGDAVPGKAEN
jgi:integral membrane protein